MTSNQPMRVLPALLLIFVLGAVLAPVGFIVHLAVSGEQQVHFWSTLWRYSGTTALLVAISVTVAFFAGVIPAFFVAIYRFPLRNFFRLSLLLPLALPGYLLAYVYADFFEYSGPIQTLIREWFGYHHPDDYSFFEVRSLGMAGVLLGVGLSPYVFAFTSASLNQHARSAFETARVLGLGATESFFRVIIPLSRPAWATGLLLVAMETMADFGAVQHLAVDTLTLGVFNLWLERGDLAAAARLALFAACVILIIGAWENHQRGQRGFQSTLAPKLGHGLAVSRWVGWGMCTVCALPLLIGFVFPIAILLIFATQDAEQFLDSSFHHALLNTLYLAGSATVFGMLISVAVALSVPRNRLSRLLLQGSVLGYMLPGTIFALGLMLLLVFVGQSVFNAYLIGGVFGLVYGYLVRFFALSHGIVRSGVEIIPASIDDAGKIYGWTSLMVWIRVKLPILRGHLLCATVVLFVEAVKELPLTLIMRPANMETLATHLYHYANDENLAQAAPGALVIVIVSVLAVSALAWLRRI